MLKQFELDVVITLYPRKDWHKFVAVDRKELEVNQKALQFYRESTKALAGHRTGEVSAEDAFEILKQASEIFGDELRETFDNE